MKTVLLTIPQIFLLTSCNNLDSGAYPPEEAYAYTKGTEFAISPGETVDLAGLTVQCLSIGEMSGNRHKVAIYINRNSSREGNEYAELITEGVGSEYVLKADRKTRIVLVSVLESDVMTSAVFRVYLGYGIL
ncbi:MAG: hypothetical protein ACM3U0_01710 [archaeon]